MSFSSLAQRANEILFASYEEVQPNPPNTGLRTSQEQQLLERLPELPPDLDAKLRDQLWNEDVLKVKKEEEATTQNQVDTMKKADTPPTSGSLRGSRSPGNNQHD